jgi:predicted glycoside hydrolase/deacetylase ChbG (UPF0249 family)
MIGGVLQKPPDSICAAPPGASVASDTVDDPAAYKRQAELLKAEGIGAPNWFIDSYFGHATVENFIALLRQLPPGSSEVMVHPAVVDEQLRQLGAGYVAERAQELAVLLDPRVREALAAYNVQLVDFPPSSRNPIGSLLQAPVDHTF